MKAKAIKNKLNYYLAEQKNLLYEKVKILEQLQETERLIGLNESSIIEIKEKYYSKCGNFHLDCKVTFTDEYYKIMNITKPSKVKPLRIISLARQPKTVLDIATLTNGNQYSLYWLNKIEDTSL